MPIDNHDVSGLIVYAKQMVGTGRHVGHQQRIYGRKKTA